MTLKDKRDLIFSSKLKEETIAVPEWGVDVLVREMNGESRARWLELTIAKQYKNMQVEVVIACTFDVESGQPMFSAPDRDSLLKLSGSAIDRITERVISLSGLSGEVDVNALAKNS